MVYSYNNNASCKADKPKVRIFNRCSYKVNVWSILKEDGCPETEGAVVEPGDFYQENYRPDAATGVSLKISKTNKCKGGDITQLEYFLQQAGMYASNYLDVSYVDCLSDDCPTKKEGFYLKSGNQNGNFLANVVNEICPILSCSSPSECAKVAYIKPNDRQTKSCNLKADLDFYMCGGHGPEEQGPEEGPEEQPSYQPEPSKPAPSPAPASSQAYQQPEPQYTPTEVNAAAITPAPAAETPKAPNVKTEVVYVTQYDYVNAKRHAHGHRHQHFRA